MTHQSILFAFSFFFCRFQFHSEDLLDASQQISHTTLLLLFCLSYERCRSCYSFCTYRCSQEFQTPVSLDVTLHCMICLWFQSVSLLHLCAHVLQQFEKDYFIFASYQMNNNPPLCKLNGSANTTLRNYRFTNER